MSTSVSAVRTGSETAGSPDAKSLHDGAEGEVAGGDGDDFAEWVERAEPHPSGYGTTETTTNIVA